MGRGDAWCTSGLSIKYTREALLFLATEKSETLLDTKRFQYCNARSLLVIHCSILWIWDIVISIFGYTKKDSEKLDGGKYMYKVMVLVKIANQELSFSELFSYVSYLPLCSFSSPSSCPCSSLHSSGVWWPMGYSGSEAKQKYVLNTRVGIVPHLSPYTCCLVSRTFFISELIIVKIVLWTKKNFFCIDFILK